MLPARNAVAQLHVPNGFGGEIEFSATDGTRPVDAVVDGRDESFLVDGFGGYDIIEVRVFGLGRLVELVLDGGTRGAGIDEGVYCVVQRMSLNLVGRAVAAGARRGEVGAVGHGRGLGLLPSNYIVVQRIPP